MNHIGHTWVRLNTDRTLHMSKCTKCGSLSFRESPSSDDKLLVLKMELLRLSCDEFLVMKIMDE